MAGSGEKTALIAGASRGLGLGLAEELLKRGWRVIATERGASKLAALAETHPAKLEIERLDTTKPDEIAALAKRLAGRRLDLLFVNAGVAGPPSERIGAVSTGEFARILVTNTLSPLRIIEALADRVPAGGVIGAMSSELGSIGRVASPGWEVYRASKAGLNILLAAFAARDPDDARSYVAMAPGWVRTDMGGPHARLDVATSMRGVADVLEARAGKRGIAYLNHKGETLPW